jgi:hypothetical protein
MYTVYCVPCTVPFGLRRNLLPSMICNKHLRFLYIVVMTQSSCYIIASFLLFTRAKYLAAIQRIDRMKPYTFEIGLKKMLYEKPDSNLPAVRQSYPKPSHRLWYTGRTLTYTTIEATKGVLRCAVPCACVCVSVCVVYVRACVIM